MALDMWIYINISMFYRLAMVTLQMYFMLATFVYVKNRHKTLKHLTRLLK